MKITRERFVDQFSITVQVVALKSWSRRSNEPPDHVGRSMYQAMSVCAGEFPITSLEFGRIVQPVIHELHKVTPKGMRPDARELTGRTYDALDAAGIEVTIKPPVEGHGGTYGMKR